MNKSSKAQIAELIKAESVFYQQAYAENVFYQQAYQKAKLLSDDQLLAAISMMEVDLEGGFGMVPPDPEGEFEAQLIAYSTVAGERNLIKDEE